MPRLEQECTKVHWYEPPTKEQKRRDSKAKDRTKRLGLVHAMLLKRSIVSPRSVTKGYHKPTADGQL